ncbi:MAG: trigger factor [Candidatus Enteromonas sp.]|nr:trigger factor [Candidatus Enteromonas sp.]
MNYTIKELGDCRVEITVDVEKDIWVGAQEKALRKAIANVQIPGFRKGKAPANLAMAHVDQNRVVNNALDSILTPVYSQVLGEAKLSPFSRPDVNITKIEPEALTLVFTLTLMPKVTLGAYTGIPAERPSVSVTEEEVAEAISKRLAASAELAVVEREAKEGDTVVLDFKGYVNGEAFDGGEAENYSLELGSHTFVPGFEEALVGVKAGDSKKVEVTFPEQYVKELAGKAAVFECTIHEVKEKTIPELSEEAIADMNLEGVKTVEELKAYERNAILQRKTNSAMSAYYESIVAKIVEGSKVEIASSIIDGDVAQREEETKKQIESNGLTFEQYLEITGQTEEKLKADLRVSCTANLKTFLVLQTIAAKEHMVVDDAELDVELSRMAEQYKMSVEDVRKALGASLENFRSNLQDRKIREFLLANNGENAKPVEEVKEEAAPEAEEAPKPKKTRKTTKKAAKPAEAPAEEPKAE